MHLQRSPRRFATPHIIVLLAGAALVTTSEAAQPPNKRPLPRPLDALAAELEPTRTEVYKRVAGRELRLHIFEPEGHRPTDRAPAFVAIHGGGWTGGNARRFYPFASHFQKLGMVGISIDYRLLNKPAGTTVFDCVKDGRSAIRYIREHAAELGIDPGRIVAGGGSAGGHVAAGTALFDGVDEANDNPKVSSTPNLLVLYYPVIDTSEAGYGQKKIGGKWREISPAHQVKPGLPPTLVLHGTGDTTTPFAGAKAFHEAMKRAGNECSLIAHEGGRHGYFIFDLKLYEQAMKQTEDFLKKYGMLP